MIPTSYNLCSNTYKNNLSKGFTALQQQQEFVDVTLAAEGHLVKAHQNILALASPYIKAMLHSAPCQHPVIFLSNVGHKVLSFILQYIYSGEVQVPSDTFSSFVKAAKLMHIVGLEHLNVPKDFRMLHEINDAQKETDAKLLENIGYESKEISPEDCVAQFKINNDSVENVITQNSDLHTDALPSYYENGLEISQNKTKMVNFENVINRETNSTETFDYNDCINQETNTTEMVDIEESINQETNATEMVDFEDIISQETNTTQIFNENGYHYRSKPEIQQNNTNINITSTENLAILTAESGMQNPVINLVHNVTHDQEPTQSIIFQGHAPKVAYTKSIRGSVQMILNRYLYNMHYQADCGRKRRWRCLDYRRKHCPAYVDTRDGIPVKRKNEHTHAFHDEKILKAGKKSLFTSLSEEKLDV